MVHVHLNWLNWFYLVFLGGRSTRYSDRLHDYLPAFLDVTKMSTSTASFLAELDLPIECFTLTSDLNRFDSRINRNLLTVGSF